MRKLPVAIIGSLLVLSLAARADQDKKPLASNSKVVGAAPQPAGKQVTLKGQFGCAKCSFKEAKQCENVLKVKEAGKDVTYHVAKNSVSDEHHEAVCHSPGQTATIKGTVSDEDGKKVITASEIKFD